LHYYANEEPDEGYQRHLQEQEVTLLRGISIDEMKRLEPGWIEVTRARFKETLTLRMNDWIEDVVAGKDNLQSLYDKTYAI
jgi:hypothetical protein